MTLGGAAAQRASKGAQEGAKRAAANSVAGLNLQVSSATFLKGISRRQTPKHNLLLQWKLSFGTPVFKGHPHSGDTKLVLEKHPYLLPLLKGHLYSGEKGHFQGPKTWL